MEYTEAEMFALKCDWIKSVHDAIDAGEVETVLPDDLP